MFLQEYASNYDYEYGELPPLNCSTTEAIKGGRVTYSQVWESILYICSLKYNILVLFFYDKWNNPPVFIKVQ